MSSKFNQLALNISALLLSTGMTSAVAGQETVNTIAEQLSVNYIMQDNLAASHGVDCASLGADWASCFKADVVLTNNGPEIKNNDWVIYLHSIRRLLAVENEQFKITHITGDLHKLEPTEKFAGFPANKSITLPIIGEYWQLFDSDIMPRWYVTSENAKPKTIKNTDSEDLSKFITPISKDLWKRTADDNNILMVPNSRFIKNADTAYLSTEKLRGKIIPTPLSLTIHQNDVDLSSGIKLNLACLSEESKEVLNSHFSRLGIKTDTGYVVNGKIGKSEFTEQMAVPGAYKLNIKPDQAEIIAFDESGIFYAVQSILSQLSATDAKTIAAVEISDAPRFQYRGAHLDVARNFHSKASVMRLLDFMATYKMNKFHFHLTDDEGWRIEIPGLPELTEVGGKRCHDLSEATCLLPQLGSGPDSDNMGSGYFSRDDYIEIVKYANARHIEVIPEIDMPAHTRAAIISMEARYNKLSIAGKEDEANKYRLLDPTDTSNTTSVQFYDRRSYLNPCLPSSLTFVDKVISEMVSMHKEAGQPITTWHFGGDEAKNIRFGAGFQDKNGEIVPGKGIIDLSKEDHPWSRSQVCQQMVQQGKVANIEHLPSYFAIEVSKIVNSHGIEKMQAWQDGVKFAKNAKEFATKRVGVNFWDTVFWGGYDTINDWAAKGYEVIVSHSDYVYLDMPNEVNPKDWGYYWATRFSDTQKIFSFVPDNLPQNAEMSVDRDGNSFSAKSDKPWPGAYGLSAQLWSESVRTDERMEFMLYPRLISVAERAWHKAEWEQPYQVGKEYSGKTNYVNKQAVQQDWQLFANLIGQRELAKLDKTGIAYRLPVPGAKIDNGILHANTDLPGLTIQYSIDGGKNWQTYNADNQPKVTGDVWVRSMSPDGKRFSRAEPINL